MSKFFLYTVLILCFVLAFVYIRFRFKKNPKEDKWFDTIVDILWPLLATCVGVIFALWIDRNESLNKQKETTVKTLNICFIDVNNTIELMDRATQVLGDNKAKDSNVTVNPRQTFDVFGIPYPEVIQNLLLNENSLSNCSGKYIEAVLRELNKLKQIRMVVNEQMSKQQYYYCMDSYYMALQEIRGMTYNEMLFIKGEISQKDHDKEIDIVLSGVVREKKLKENAAERSKQLKIEE